MTIMKSNHDNVDSKKKHQKLLNKNILKKKNPEIVSMYCKCSETCPY